MNDEPSRDLTVFATVAKLPAEEQAAYLARECGDDHSLRARVETLLRAHSEAGDFMQQRLGAFPASTVSVIGEKAGDRIGRYKLLQQIGEGGCGIVFMAEQEEPVHRQVALKIIKPGMDTRGVIARFEAERQALALMDHPNIAKVFDGGATESGRPFFVMELIRGIKITDYCDQNSLSITERLELFVRVCQAVQHAHQKGIIHRDIKPSNILISKTAEGAAVPMVIDFGIAKATTKQRLSDQTVFTAQQMLIGTPAYMSPEQAEMSGVDVDTRADIYSLGVLLYELLTGFTPFDCSMLMDTGPDEIRRVIREKEPDRPSTRLKTMAAGDLTATAQHRHLTAPILIRSVQGDLDWIVTKCLEKDRTRRYETTNGLTMDIERHLHNEPVLARPPSRLYRFAKMARRNKVTFAAAGVIAAVLVLSVVVSTWQAVRATRATKAEARQRQAAQLSQKDAEVVTRYLMTVFQSPDPTRDGRTITVAESLDRAALRLDKDLARQPAQLSKLQGVIGRTYHSLGLDQQAIPLLEKTRDYYVSNFGLENTNTLGAMTDLANSYFSTGRLDEALKLREQALRLMRRTLGPEHTMTLTAMLDLAKSYQDEDNHQEALKLREEGLVLLRKILGPEAPTTLLAMNDLATSYQFTGREDEALKLRERVLELRRKILGPEHPDTVKAMNNLAMSYDSLGRQEEAFNLAKAVLELRRKVLGPEHPDTFDAMNNLAISYDHLGRREEALKLREEANRVLEQIFEERRKDRGPHSPDTVRVMAALAYSYQNLGHQEEANKMLEQMVEVQRQALGPQHPNTVNAMLHLAYSYGRCGRRKEAERILYTSIEFQPTEHIAYHGLLPLLVATGDLNAYRTLCEQVLARFGQTTDSRVAERMAKDCLILRGSVSNLSAVAQLADTAVTLGKSFVHFNQFAKALAEYRKGNFARAVEWADKALVEHGYPFRDVQAYMVLAMAHFQLKQKEEASATLRKGLEIEQAQGPPGNGPDLGTDWGDWIIARELMKEAKALVEGSAQNP